MISISLSTDTDTHKTFPSLAKPIYRPIPIPYRNYIAGTLAPGKVVREALEKFCMKLTIKFYDISKNLFMNDLIAALNSMHFFSFFIDILFMIFHIQIFFILNV